MAAGQRSFLLDFVFRTDTKFGLRRFIIFGSQAGFVFVSALLSYWLRFEFSLPTQAAEYFPIFLAFSFGIKLSFFQIYRLNRGWWRYTSLSDMAAVIKAVTASQMLLSVALFAFAPKYFPRSVLLMDYFITLLMMGGSRLTFRWLYEKDFQVTRRRRRASDGRIIIVGAGEAGIALLRQLKKAVDFHQEIVGFLDDSKIKIGTRFHGVPVLGTIDELVAIVKSNRISEVYIAIPSLRKKGLQRITDHCIEAKIPFKAIPSLREMIELGSRAYQLREVKVEDLLGREPIQLDKTKTAEEIRDRVILVTGAGGSIGSELCRQILGFNPKRLLLFERSEYNLFQIHRKLKHRFSGAKILPIVGDLLDRAGLEAVFEKYRPEVVYHAAAHKHVHLMETSSREAVRNNVFGTKNIAEVANQFLAEKFVMISTDKAVNPLSVMGYSKRLAELVIQSMAGLHTEFISVRFGNVLGSSGSAVEIFRKQIEGGGPVTVTHPEATRFFMTTPEAVELVLHAGSHGKSGHIYMLDMGQPVKILDLANKMIQLSDPEEKREIKVEITGLWPGEKLQEELVWRGEDFIPSQMEKVFTLKNRVSSHELPLILEELEANMQASHLDMATELKRIVDMIDSKSRMDSPRGLPEAQRIATSM